MTEPSHDAIRFIDPADQVAVLKNLACSSLVYQGYMHSMVCAHHNQDPLFLATLRPYAKGDHLNPVAEVLELATTLRANRIAFCSTGRAWSMDDPIEPVCETGDLRQRVVVVSQVDITRPKQTRSVMQTYLWPLEECVTGANPSILDGGSGPLANLLETAAHQHSPVDLPPWQDDNALEAGARLLLGLEQRGHTIVSVGPKLEHTLGRWIDRLTPRLAS